MVRTGATKGPDVAPPGRKMSRSAVESADAPPTLAKTKQKKTALMFLPLLGHSCSRDKSPPYNKQVLTVNMGQ